MNRIVFTVWALALALALMISPAALSQDAPPPLAPSITDASARALIAAAEAIDMEQDPAGARAAWQAAHDAAQALDGVAAHDRAAIINQLGSAIFYDGGREAALANFQEAADIFASAGPEHREALEQSLGNVASILATLGRLEEAEAVQRQVLDIRRALYPENHPQIARSYFELGSVLNARGDLDNAIALVERSLDIRRAVLEDGHPHIAMTQVSLAAILIRAHRYGDAAELSRSAAEQLEANLPPGHPFIGFAQSSYAGALNAWGRYEAAEPLLRRILEDRRASLGEAHPQVADTLNNLGVALFAQGRAAEARPLFLAARDIYRNAAGADSVEAARMQMNAADAALAAGEMDAARSEYLNSLAVFDAAGTGGPDRLRVLTELAALETLSGDFDMGRQYLGDARALAASYLPEGHERRLELAIDEAWISAMSGDAMRFVPRAANNAVTALAADLSLVDVDSARDMARRRQRAFRRALDVAFAASDAEAAFRYMQHVQMTGLALAAEATALRARAEGVDAANLIRARQDGWRAVRLAEESYIRVRSAAGTPDPQALANARDAYDAARAGLGQLTDAGATPGGLAGVSLQTVRDALQPQETIVAFAFTPAGGVSLRITPDEVHMDRLAIDADTALEAVTTLRSALEAGPSGGDVRPFPAEQAHQLYAGVFTPRLTQGLEAETTLLIVADGPYRSIPFTVLLTDEFDAPLTDGAGLRAAPWLIRRHATAALPDFSSLTARHAHGGGVRDPFLMGFGAPDFAGEGDGGPVTMAALVRSGGGESATRSLSSLAPLPGARAELEELALVFGADRSDIRLGADATEAAVKTADLSRASTLVFATHGLLSGELETVLEPALAFTPPDESGPLDDGLLTASEIARLPLNADWVVLSACNTFAADGAARSPDRLAQAFLYAGARSLLVSHWTVRDDAAAAITAQTARRSLAGEPRAQAFRNAVLRLMQDDTIDGSSHPGVWGPFALIGQ